MKKTTKQNTTTTKPAKLKRILWIGSGIVLVGITAYLLLNLPNSPIKTKFNLAAEVAAPLEEALVKVGGVKKCDKGDPGFGGDNWEPWYVGVYQLQVGRGEAIEIIKKVGKENGYELKTTQQVDDPHVNIILKDNNKQSQYNDLKNGPILASAIIDSRGDDGTCGGSLYTNENQSVLLIQISLPARKITH